MPKLGEVTLVLHAGTDGAAVVRAVKRFAQRYSLQITAHTDLQHCMVLRGSQVALARVFGTPLAGSGRYHVPVSLKKTVRAVLGAGDSTPATVHGRVPKHWGPATNPHHVARYYNFPENHRAQGQTIGIVLLGGGFHRSDLEHYFRRMRLTLPEIVTVELDGWRNTPADKAAMARYIASVQKGTKVRVPPTGRNSLPNMLWTWEATQDIQLVGTFANHAKLVVYFGANDEQGRYRVLNRAIHDRTYSPSVLCCSWHVGFEHEVTPRERLRLNGLFRLAARRGVTICVASGDLGDGTHAAPGQPPSPVPRVCFPASSPHVLACGGSTQVLARRGPKERVWEEVLFRHVMGSGGGVSRLYQLPSWQRRAGVVAKTRRQGRGVPDVAAKANLRGGYWGFLGGTDVRNGGTSAAAPLWASLVAVLNQVLGRRLGFINPMLYHPRHRGSLREILFGGNGPSFRASPGWNPCTGLGTPVVESLIVSLGAYKRDARQRRAGARANDNA